MPIRWRLAVVSAGLTGIILLLFAVVIGSFTVQRIRGDFTTQTAARFDALREQLDLRINYPTVTLRNNVKDIRGDSTTVVKVWARTDRGFVLLGDSDPKTDIGSPTSKQVRFGDYRVASRQFQQPVRDAKGKIVTGARRSSFRGSGATLRRSGMGPRARSAFRAPASPCRSSSVSAAAIRRSSTPPAGSRRRSGSGSSPARCWRCSPASPSASGRCVRSDG